MTSISPPTRGAAARVGTVRDSTSRISQLVTLVAVVVPALGLLSAMGLLWGVAFHWVDLALLVGLYVLCAFGTTIGFHRYFTHRGFETGPVLKSTLAILGCMTMQGPITQWVTDHRKHHALSDQEGDPHSPHVGHGDGTWGVVKGFVHAHVGWMFSNLGHGAGPRVRQGPLRGPAGPDDRPPLPALGRAHPRDPVRDRLRGRRHARAPASQGSSGAAWCGSSPTSTRPSR